MTDHVGTLASGTHGWSISCDCGWTSGEYRHHGVVFDIWAEHVTTHRDREGAATA